MLRWFLIFTWSFLEPNLQERLDNLGNIYVVEKNYLAVHSHMLLWKRVLRLKKNSRFKFYDKMCKVRERVIVNYTKDTTLVLTGWDLFIQVCTENKDLAYLFKTTCN